MVDANQGYDRAEAVDFGRRVADLDIRWFEEPCRWTNDRRWMRDVRFQTGLPVTAGQSEVTLSGLRDLVVDGAIDVSATSMPRGPAAPRSGARRPACAPRSASSWATTRSRRSRRICSRACPATPSWSASTRSAIRSSGSSADLSIVPAGRRLPPAGAAGLRHRSRPRLRGSVGRGSPRQLDLSHARRGPARISRPPREASAGRAGRRQPPRDPADGHEGHEADASQGQCAHEHGWPHTEVFRQPAGEQRADEAGALEDGDP